MSARQDKLDNINKMLKTTVQKATMKRKPCLGLCIAPVLCKILFKSILKIEDKILFESIFEILS